MRFQEVRKGRVVYLADTVTLEHIADVHLRRGVRWPEQFLARIYNETPEEIEVTDTPDAEGILWLNADTEILDNGTGVVVVFMGRYTLCQIYRHRYTGWMVRLWKELLQEK